MVAKELRDKMERMSQFELQELAAYADQLRLEARQKEIMRGLEDIVDRWSQLLACVQRVQKELGIDEFWVEARDWSAPGPEGEATLIPVGKFIDGDFTFSVQCREDDGTFGQTFEKRA